MCGPAIATVQLGSIGTSVESFGTQQSVERLRAFILKSANREEEDGVGVASAANSVQHNDNTVAPKRSLFRPKTIKVKQR